MKFLVFEDNGGRYRWTAIAASGDSLVQSASFASYEEAQTSRVHRDVDLVLEQNRRVFVSRRPR